MRLNTTQKIISIKDERLDIDRIDRYRLSFFISSEECQISIYDIQKKQLLMLENRPFNPQMDMVENLQEIYDDHILIAAGFWKEIQVFFRNRQFSLVPYPVFDKSLLKEYVRLNEPTDPNQDEYRFKILDDLGLTIAFAHPIVIKQWFREKYPKTSLYFNHQSIGYLKGLKGQLRNKAQSSLYVSLNHNEVQIAGFNLSRIAIYNQFKFSDVQQLVKLILLTVQQFSDAGQAIPILLHGKSELINPNLSTLKKYFKNIDLGQRPSGVMIHPVFNELDDQEYFDVLSNL